MCRFYLYNKLFAKIKGNREQSHSFPYLLGRIS